MSKITTLLLIALTAISSLALAGESSTVNDSAFASYETLRQALLHDKLDGVEDAAQQLATDTQKLFANAQDSKAKEALKAATFFSSQLASASDIKSARKTFGDLSDAMVTYRNTLQGERPVVAYCPMANKHWLQPDENIGNPYYGQSMASCGEVVKDKASTESAHHNH